MNAENNFECKAHSVFRPNLFTLVQNIFLPFFLCLFHIPLNAFAGTLFFIEKLVLRDLIRFPVILTQIMNFMSGLMEQAQKTICYHLVREKLNFLFYFIFCFSCFSLLSELTLCELAWPFFAPTRILQ